MQKEHFSSSCSFQNYIQRMSAFHCSVGFPSPSYRFIHLFKTVDKLDRFLKMWSSGSAGGSLNEWLIITRTLQVLLPAICGLVGYCSRRIFGSSNPSTCWRQLSSSFSFMVKVKLCWELLQPARWATEKDMGDWSSASESWLDVYWIVINC